MDLPRGVLTDWFAVDAGVVMFRFCSRLNWINVRNVGRRNFLSAPTLPQLGCAEVIMIPLLEDNYSYVVVDRYTKQTAVIDPGESAPVISVIEALKLEKNIEFTSVLCTHKHADHIGGNEDIKQHFPNIQIVGPAYEEIPAIDRRVYHDDTFTIGTLNVKVIYTPCHTQGHICFLFSSNITSDCPSQPILFAGDTLFAGGCGRFFEGTAEQMLHNMNELSALPIVTQIYCGHEYTLSNLSFLKDASSRICPSYYSKIVEYWKRAAELREANLPTLPSTIADELSYNFFLLCNDLAIQESVGRSGDPVGTMQELRQLKNNFKS